MKRDQSGGDDEKCEEYHKEGEEEGEKSDEDIMRPGLRICEPYLEKQHMRAK